MLLEIGIPMDRKIGDILYAALLVLLVARAARYSLLRLPNVVVTILVHVAGSQECVSYLFAKIVNVGRMGPK